MILHDMAPGYLLLTITKLVEWINNGTYSR